MYNFQRVTFPESIKLFEFLDSDTPAVANWVYRYLSKQGINHLGSAIQMPVKQLVLELVEQQIRDPGQIKLFAKKMANAWRIRKHRQKKDVVSLSVSIEKSVADHLSKMSKGRKKADVVSMLIKNNFQTFLVEENLRKTKWAEEKIILKKQRQLVLSEKRHNKPSSEITQVVSQANQVAECMESIAHLYEIILYAHNRGEAIDNQTLIQAKKIYCAAFNK